MSDAKNMLLDGVEMLKDRLLWSLSDLTDEQRYFSGRTSGHITAIGWQITRNLERVIHGLVQKKPEIWEAKGYNRALKSPAEGGARWPASEWPDERALSFQVEPWNEFLRYTKDVLDSIQSYVANASEEELESAIDGRSRYQVLQYDLVSPSYALLGEIFTLRAIQGLKGSPT